VNDFITYLLIAAGVAIGVLYPVLVGHIRHLFPKVAAPHWWRKPWVRKYSLLLAFSLITALIVLAFVRSAQPQTQFTWYAALLLGIGWEATIEKAYIGATKP